MSSHVQVEAARAAASREQNGVDASVPFRGSAVTDSVRTDPEADARRIQLDNEDLRFECRRLKASLALAQAELLQVSERNAMLQRRLERFRPYLPIWGARLVRVLLRPLRRH